MPLGETRPDYRPFRAARSTTGPLVIGTITALVIFAAVFVAGNYARAEVVSAKGEIERLKADASAMLKADKVHQAKLRRIGTLGALGGMVGAKGSVEGLADAFTGGELRRMEVLALDARYCEVALDREFRIVELVVFEPPVACRAMSKGKASQESVMRATSDGAHG